LCRGINESGKTASMQLHGHKGNALFQDDLLDGQVIC